MEKTQHGVVLEAELPSSQSSTNGKVKDGQQEPTATSQTESTSTAAEQGTQHASPPGKTPHHTGALEPSQEGPTGPSPPTRHRVSCASPEFQAQFVEWPFHAPSRAQTVMPFAVRKLVYNVRTPQEYQSALLLWNPSLPIAANVGTIEYNRVDGVTFKEKVEETWWEGLEHLASELNVAARVVRGESQMVESAGGQVKGSENVGVDEFGEEVQEPQKKTRGHLVQAAALLPKTEGRSEKGSSETTTDGGIETQTYSDAEATAAEMRFLILSSIATNYPPLRPEILAAQNPLSALWYLISVFFSAGPVAAAYLFVTLEASIRALSTTIHPLHIPASPAFWANHVPWTAPKSGMVLILTLAASKRNAFNAFARFTRSLGEPALSVSQMRSTPTTSLRKAVLRAKADASTRGRTTILGVNLRDVRYAERRETDGRDIETKYATFARMFVLGICPYGAKLWLLGGGWGETATVWEGNAKMGGNVGTWEELDDFVREFEGFAVADGEWNSKRFKWYYRCFAVDLKQFDLGIDPEEKQKRGMQEKAEGTKILHKKIKAWVEIYKIENVKMEDVGKFLWL